MELRILVHLVSRRFLVVLVLGLEKLQNPYLVQFKRRPLVKKNLLKTCGNYGKNADHVLMLRKEINNTTGKMDKATITASSSISSYNTTNPAYHQQWDLCNTSSSYTDKITHFNEWSESTSKKYGLPMIEDTQTQSIPTSTWMISSTFHT